MNGTIQIHRNIRAVYFLASMRRFIKEHAVPAVSFFYIVDVVVYRDEDGRYYTLNLIQDRKSTSFREVWMMATMMDNFAPEEINGEVEFENRYYIGIRMSGVLYRFRYGIPSFIPFLKDEEWEDILRRAQQNTQSS